MLRCDYKGAANGSNEAQTEAQTETDKITTLGQEEEPWAVGLEGEVLHSHSFLREEGMQVGGREGHPGEGQAGRLCHPHRRYRPESCHRKRLQQASCHRQHLRPFCQASYRHAWASYYHRES